MNRVVDIREKLSLVSEHWSPKVVARLNDYEVKVVKLEGDFVWHSHDDTDELFLVIEGDLTIQLRDGDVPLREGQLYVVPRGVEHRPVADGEVAVMLIEPAGVVNTGDAGGDLTAAYDDSLLPEATSPATSERVPRSVVRPRHLELATWVDSRDFDVAYLDPATGEAGRPSKGATRSVPTASRSTSRRPTGMRRVVPAPTRRTRTWRASLAQSVTSVPRSDCSPRSTGLGRSGGSATLAWHLPRSSAGPGASTASWGRASRPGVARRHGTRARKDVAEARSAREAAARAILDAVG